MRRVVLSEASFPNAPDLKSQIGYVILLAHKSGCPNIVHDVSSRCHRVSVSVIIAEVLAISYAVDMEMVVTKALSELLHRNV